MMQHAPHASTTGFAHPRHNVAALGIAPGMSVADFGSGSGAYVFAIAQKLEGKGYVYAVDVQKDLLRRITNESHHRGYENVRVIWGDLERTEATKLADGLLDLVLISNLLFQVDDKEAVIGEAMRILKPLGTLAIIDWSESYGGLGPHKNEILKMTDSKELAESAGFKFTKEFPAGAHHYGLLFESPQRII